MTTTTSQLTDDWTRAVGEPAPGFPSLTGQTLLRNQYARVPDRAFIELAGVDTARYLQGMITNHMPSIENGGEGMHAAFLTPQGRVMADVFIYPRNEGCAFPHPVFLIECPASEQANLMAHMQKYKLRAKVTIRAANEYAAWSVWGPNATDRLWWRHQVNETDAARLPPGQLVKRDGVGFADIGMTDTRASHMGFRVVCRNDDTSLRLPSEFSESSPDDYTTWRILRGVAEGCDDFVPGQALPLECNLDYMNGVNFCKGCYIGQELTIRTYHKGVVRKRLLPVQLLPDDVPEDRWSSYAFTPMTNPPVAGADLHLTSASSPPTARASRRPPAKLCSVAPKANVALAMVRLEHVQNGEVFRVGNTNWLARPWIPKWWPTTATATAAGEDAPTST